MNIIRAQFMHQYRDKAVYGRDIVIDSPSLNQYYGKPATYLEFDMPLLMDVEPEFVRRWLKRYIETYRNTHVTRRPLRFVGSDGTILYELSQRPLKANLCITRRDLSTIHVCLAISPDEAKLLGKIFFK